MTRIQLKGRKKSIHKYLKHKALYTFIDQFLKPVLNTQRSGVYLKVRTAGGHFVTKKFVVYVLFFSIDTEEGNRLCGTYLGQHKCRMCEGSAWDFNTGTMGALRNGKFYEMYQKIGDTAFLKSMLDLPLTVEESDVLAHNKEFSVINVANPLHRHFKPGNRNVFQGTALYH